MTNLSKKLGEMNFDGLFTDVVPAVQVRGGIIRKQTTSAVTLKRGTILAKSYGTAGDGKLVILGSTAANNETLTPDCVLCDDVEVGTAADENVAVYTAGCFDPDKVTVAESYTISQTDKDNLYARHRLQGRCCCQLRRESTMSAELNFFDTYILMAITEEIVPRQTFFKDRYFPTGDGDIFASDKVLTEYRKGDRKMAAFVSARAGDIPMERRGFEIHEYQPAFIAPSRLLTQDDLRKRGFGEAIYANSTPAQRAARLQRDDLSDMDIRITRREEWMAVQTMINNSCTMQSYIDDKTEGEKLYVQFYDTTSDHAYTVSTKWNATDEKGAAFFSDVKNMCRKLSKRGLRAADLVIGSDVADAILALTDVKSLLDRNSGIIIGTIDQQLSPYDGVTYMGTLNFGGFRLNVICVDETYVDDSGAEQRYFPATSAMVTAPDCGHMMYGQITQIDYGSTDFSTYVAKRVPKFVLDQPNDRRKLRLAARPLAAPKNYCPYIYAANVVA